MKKLLLIIAFCTFFLVSCDKNLKTEDVLEDIRNHYNNLMTIEHSVTAVTSISNKSQTFKFDFLYNYDDFDTVTITSPLEISGITTKIEKDNDELKILFDEFSLETLIVENLGISPVDVTSFAIFDLKNKIAESISVSDVIKICYLDEEISKTIYLNLQTYDIIKIEVFVSGDMVIYCNYSQK